MTVFRIMGLNVVDDEEYQKYRDAMTPLMESYGGRFNYDFTIAEVLKSQTPAKINRVFIMSFESEHAMHDFFNDEAYLAIREKHFNLSVESITSLAELAAG